MRRANPQKFGIICRLCAEVPARPALGTLPRAALSSSRSIAHLPRIRDAGVRWHATASLAADTNEAPRGLAKMASSAELVRIAESSCREVMAAEDIPDQQVVVNALRACLQAATTLHPHMKRAEAQHRASVSRLAQLGAERTGAKSPMPSDLAKASDRLSHAAYNIIQNPNVEINEDLLELYVHIQSQLGRPETLPSVLELFAHKAKPVLKDGKVHCVSQSPNAAAKAIPKEIADVALQIAIDARNLDAALGITEASFCVTAFKRQKLIKRGTAPALGFLSLPFGIFGLGTAYASYWQNTMDISTATGIGVAGISGYLLVTGSMGLISKLSHKDQMKRVTWLPGTPLRYRWMREEEREALDKIACAWGFKESWRHGEETGPEWEGLREYMGYRQMILDRVEFMEGMN